jgi:hypothetical protein
MLDRAVATRHQELTRVKTTLTRTPLNMHKRLRIFKQIKQKCLRLLRRLGDLISAGGPLS